MRLQVRVTLQTPLPNGLRDAAEAEALHRVEDTLAPAMESRLEAIYPVTALTDGCDRTGCISW